MGIGRLRCPVIDVDDLAIAERFWSEVTGLPVIPSVFPGRYSYLGQPDPWRHEVILHLVKTRKGTEANRSHVDIWVPDIDTAIVRIEAIGGTLKKPPSIYPRPGSYPGEPPCIDWAVMQDPFGNEFCLVTVLTPDQVQAVAQAARHGDGDDHHWRAAAGTTAGRSTA
jgi:catechol 2,3-dioxygenase-like lactoylglutathione lyase family enzyme